MKLGFLLCSLAAVLMAQSPVVNRASDQMLRVSGCSSEKPCTYRITGNTFTLVHGCDISLTAKEARVTVALSEHGLVVLSPGGVKATSPCMVAPDTGSRGDLPVSAWIASDGKWEPAGRPLLTPYASCALVSPDNSVLIDLNAEKTAWWLRLPDSLVAFSKLYTQPPRSSSDACMPGQWSVDDDHLYRCSAKKKWRRVAFQDMP